MKKKILKISASVFLVLSLFITLALSCFALDRSFIGADNYIPNTASMTVNYLDKTKTASNPGRFSLNGFVNYSGGSNSSRNSGSNQTRTFSTSQNDRFGYEFSLVYAAEAFIDFGYIRYSTVPLVQSDRFVFYFYLECTDPMGLIPDDEEVVEYAITYITSDFSVATRYDTVSANAGEINLSSLLGASLAQDVVGICKIQFGFNYSSYYVAENEDYFPYVDGRLMISNFSDWKRTEPFKNSAFNLYQDSYRFGYDTAVSELDGGSLNDAFNRGYENGYSIGYQKGAESAFSEGFNNGKTEGYNDGYSQGNLIGYRDGYNQGVATLEEDVQQAYNEGRTAGRNAGYTIGFSEGRTEGFEQGKLAGIEDGFSTGYAEGENDGYQNGYDKGVSESIEEMGLFNYIVSSCNAIFQIPLGKTFTLGGLLAVIISIPLLLALIKLLGA